MKYVLGLKFWKERVLSKVLLYFILVVGSLILFCLVVFVVLVGIIVLNVMVDVMFILKNWWFFVRECFSNSDFEV